MDNKCGIIDWSVHPTLVINSKTPQSKLEEIKGIAYKSIRQYLNTIGREMDGEFFTSYKSMDIDNLDVDFGCTLSEPVEGKNEISKDEIPEGKYVSSIFNGSYDKIESTYEELMIYANEVGYETVGTIYEFNIDDGIELAEGNRKLRVMLLLKTKE